MIIIWQDSSEQTISFGLHLFTTSSMSPPLLLPVSTCFVSLMKQKMATTLPISQPSRLPTLHELFAQRPILHFCVFLLFVVLCAFFRLGIKKSDCKRKPEHFQAFLSIATPTQSKWPTAYSALLSHSHSSGRIDISLTGLMDDIFSGCLELRDPYNDFPELFCDEVQAYGSTIRILVGWWWWIKVLSWLFFSCRQPKVCVKNHPVVTSFTFT
jgi:hypothetical protein